jgi:HlyD family secretion protein
MKIERTHVVTVAAVAVVAALAALSLRPERIAVDIAEIARGPLRVTVDEDGETRVEDRYLVSAPVTGRLVRLTCEVGDEVDAREVVAHIFPLPLDTRTRSEAGQRLEAAEATARAATARAEQAQALWAETRRALERLERVATEVPGSVASQRLDEARTAERTSALAVEEAEGAADAAAHEVESARASLAGSGTESAEPTVVRSPAAGRVLRVFEECERVVLVGSPIAEIGDPDRLEVVVDVLTEDASRLRVGAPASVSAGASADTLRGSILRIEPSAFTKVSPLGVEEQRVNVVVAFEGGGVLLGDRYRVDTELVAWEADDVLLVPMSALFRSESLWSVYVVVEGRARLRNIELGERGRSHAEVRSGLSAGELVVLYPSEAIEDGVRVVVPGA